MVAPSRDIDLIILPIGRSLPGYVVAGAEVDHQVERGVGERQQADVGALDRGVRQTGGGIAGGAEERGVDVDADEPHRVAQPVERGEGVAAAAADLQHLRAGRVVEPEQAHH